MGFVLMVSIIVILVMGDVMVVVLFEICGFIVDDFVLFYFGGSLGKCLLFILNDVMYSGDVILIVYEL